jgi:hypothetical protein
MQQFTVPQFIDVEDKIIGPLTTRQFLISLVAAIMIAIYYKLFDFSLFVTITVITVLIWFVLAFIRINGRPFHFFLLNFIQTLKRPGLRVWQLIESHIEMIEEPDIIPKEIIPTKNINLKTSRLDQMSLIVDTYGQYRGEDLDEPKNTHVRK